MPTGMELTTYHWFRNLRKISRLCDGRVWWHHVPRTMVY